MPALFNIGGKVRVRAGIDLRSISISPPECDDLMHQELTIRTRGSSGYSSYDYSIISRANGHWIIPEAMLEEAR